MSRPRKPPFDIAEVLARPGQLLATTPGPNLRATYALVVAWWNDGDLTGPAGHADALQLCTIAAALDDAFAAGAGPVVDKLSRNWQELRAALAPTVRTESTDDLLAALGTPALRHTA